MSKNNVILLVVVVLVVVVAGLFGSKMNKERGYSVIYMTTGQIYVGKLSTFSDLELTDGYILQVVKYATDENKNNFQLQPINEALWAPKSMHITKDNVVFHGLLSETSSIAKTLAEKGK